MSERLTESLHDGASGRNSLHPGNALIKLSRYTLDRCSKVNEIHTDRHPYTNDRNCDQCIFLICQPSDMSSERPVQDTQRAVENKHEHYRCRCCGNSHRKCIYSTEKSLCLIFSVLMIASIKPSTIERITRITENFSVVTKLLRNVPSVKIFV